MYAHGSFDFYTQVSKKADTRIRIKDIAERAKVSVGTVDRVLHNRGEVAEETRKLIMKIVEDLGYTPNLLAKSLASKKQYRIAVLMPVAGSRNPYWEMPLKGIRQAQSELADYNTVLEITHFEMNGEASFMRAYRKVLKSVPDGIVFTPLFYGVSLDLCAELDQAAIPYVFMDMQLETCSNLSYYGQDAVQSGLLAARLMHYGLRAGDRVIILKLASPEGVTHHLKRRERGFLQFFDSPENTKKITSRSLEFNPGNDRSLFADLDNMMTDNPELGGIFVTNSKVHKVAQWAGSRKYGNILLIGYDLIAPNLDYLEKGKIDFLIGQKPEEQGYKSVMAMFNFLVGKREVNKVNYSSIDIIMRENIDYYRNYAL